MGTNKGSLEETSSTGGSNRDLGLNLTLSEYKKAVSNSLWKKAKVFEGYKNNKEANKTKEEANSNPVSPDEGKFRYISFMKDINKVTIRAKTRVKGEKFISLAFNDDGEVVITNVAILTGQGGDVTSFAKDAGAIAHFHYEGLGQEPYGADHTAVKYKGIPSFVVGEKTRRIWEIGQQGVDFYKRRIDEDKTGEWQLAPEFK